MSVTTAIILAGGFGTRLQAVVSDVPKPMAPVRGKPFLEFMLKRLEAQGVKNVVLSTGHLGQKLKEHFGTRSGALHLRYSHETTPLGTGGAVKQALGLCADKTVLVLNGDSMFDIDLNSFYQKYLQSGADCSIALRRVPDGSRYGSIQTDEQQNVISFAEKNGAPGPALINGGVYILGREIFLEYSPPDVSFSIEKDFFEKVAGTIRLKGFIFDDYFIDIGIPADYARAQHEFERFEH